MSTTYQIIPAGVHIETTNTCNRRCAYCSHGQTPEYHLPPKKMSMEVFEKIISDLKKRSFCGALILCCANEPMLDDRMSKLIMIATKELPQAYLYLFSNCDLASEKLIDSYFSNGLKRIIYSRHDSKNDELMFSMLEKYGNDKIQITDMTTRTPDTLHNFAGHLCNDDVSQKRYVYNSCELPFLQIIIDVNGNFNLCCGCIEDFDGRYNVMDIDIFEFFFHNETLNKYRKKLETGDRRGLHRCEECSYNGNNLGFDMYEPFLGPGYQEKCMINMDEEKFDSISSVDSSICNMLTDTEYQQLFSIISHIVNEGRSLDLFYSSEFMGVHILPDSYYSPIPNTSKLPDKTWDVYDISDLKWDEKKMFALLSEIAIHRTEVNNIPMEKEQETEYYFNNPMFHGMDAVVYYYMIRYFKPKKLIEIGSGYSTLIAAKAISYSAAKAISINDETQLFAIEPYPPAFLEGLHGLSLIQKPVQEMPTSFFEQLNSGDILFIDSSHVSKIGSDVNYIFLRILPKLKRGVIIHFHDIFIPFEFSKVYVNKLATFWNEQ
jgi:predicted O-methyltransferase YrrM